MVFVLNAVVDTLPTLLATAAAALFAMMAWVGGQNTLIRGRPSQPRRDPHCRGARDNPLLRAPRHPS